MPISYARAYYIMSWPLLLVFLQIERNTAQVNSLAYKRTSVQQLPKTSTRQLINLKNHQLKNSSTRMLIHSKPHQLKSSSTRKLIHSKAHPLKNSSSQRLIHSKDHQLANSSTQKNIHSKAHPLKSSPTQKLTNSSTPKLKTLSFILQSRSNFRAILAKILVKKLANIRYFSSFMPSGLSVFKPGTYILHHIAFLFCLPVHYFSPPITPF